MKNLVQCSKANIKQRVYMYPVLLLIPRTMNFVFKSQNYYTPIIRYISLALVMLIILYDYFFRCKKVDVTIDANQLVEDYKNDKSESDKKYNKKYLKIEGVIATINIYKDKLDIELEGNDDYLLNAYCVLATKKSLKYIKEFYKGDRITIYDDLYRRNNKLDLDIVYLK